MITIGKYRILFNTLTRLVCLLVAITAFMTGCISFKHDDLVETVVIDSTVVTPEEAKVLVNHGITAKFTHDRGQVFMELFWWNKRKISKTVKLCKRDAALKTTAIGFFPGAAAKQHKVSHSIASLLVNPLIGCLPTISSLLCGPFMDPADGTLCEMGIFGVFSYLDRENPMVLRTYDEQKVVERIEETPIRLLDFTVEIEGQAFHGENGVAYVGSVVGDKTALKIKVLSFSPPEGFSHDSVSPVYGGEFLAKVPTAAEIALEAEQKRLLEIAIAQQKQAELAAVAAQEAAQRELALALANAAVQGVNAGMAARNGVNHTPIVTPSPMSVSRGTQSSLPRTCPACYGTTKCRPCNGTGGNPAKKHIEGRLYDPLVSARCGPCRGTGKCLTCGGKGSL